MHRQTKKSFEISFIYYVIIQQIAFRNELLKEL